MRQNWQIFTDINNNSWLDIRWTYGTIFCSSFSSDFHDEMCMEQSVNCLKQQPSKGNFGLMSVWSLRTCSCLFTPNECETYLTEEDDVDGRNSPWGTNEMKQVWWVQLLTVVLKARWLNKKEVENWAWHCSVLGFTVRLPRMVPALATKSIISA